MMAIQPDEYNKLKEYWDYQRKVEYNRESVYDMAQKMTISMNDVYATEDFKKMLWDKVPTSEYEDPPIGWVPENEEFRLWNEQWPPKPLLTKPKGRPVVLRAKKNDDNNI